MSRAPSRAKPKGAKGKPAPRRAPARVVTPAARRSTPTIGQQVGKALEAIPVPRKLVRTLRNWSFGIVLVAGLGAGITAMGIPRMAGLAIAHGLGSMGFVVRNIQITGRSHVEADAVYSIAADMRGQDMPLVDLSELRERILKLGWIEEARVSRRLPDTLVVDLVERAPAAILQRNYRLYLIDDAGHTLAPVDPHTMPVQLPLVIGEGVEAHVPALHALVASQPSLKQAVTGATWVGNRRWDLRFQSGETLALPEGDNEARTAYALFARKDTEQRLLGRGFVRFDMRTPGQMVVRVSQEPGAKIDEPPPPPPAPVDQHDGHGTTT